MLKKGEMATTTVFVDTPAGQQTIIGKTYFMILTKIHRRE